MHTIVVGLNYKSADVTVREKCHFSSDKLDEALKLLTSYESINGAVILSTCNRVEIYASTSHVNKGFDDIIDFISSYHNISKDIISEVFYKKNCHQAVIHLFKVASGIDSMVVGEYQIQGQVRDAYNMAYRLNYTDNSLNKLFQSAINTGKRVRRNTKIGKGSVSVANLAVELIKKLYPQGNIHKILIVGAGKMASLAATNLKESGPFNIIFSNRSINKANELATKFNGTAIDFNSRYEALKTVEIIVVTTSSDTCTIQFDDVKQIMDEYPNKPKLFIDLSIPRNIDPEINQLDNCMVYSIDYINKIIDINVNNRKLEIDKAETIVEEVSEEFYSWYYKQIIMPTMHNIKDKLELLKQKTIDGYKPEFCAMAPSQQKLTETILSTYSERLITLIMKNLTVVTSKEEIVHLVDSLKKSFSVDESINEVLNNPDI